MKGSIQEVFELARLGAALKEWRKSQNLSLEEVEARCGNKARVRELRRYERGEVAVPLPKLFQTVLPAYGIETVNDFDLFLDRLFGMSNTEARVFKRDGISEIRAEHVTTHQVDPRGLFPHRTRVDVHTIRAGQQTQWRSHGGHEYVLVLDGTVDCEVSETEHGVRTTHSLRQGEIIALPNFVWHTIRNSGRGDARVAVARPSKSPTTTT